MKNLIIFQRGNDAKKRVEVPSDETKRIKILDESQHWRRIGEKPLQSVATHKASNGGDPNDPPKVNFVSAATMAKIVAAGLPTIADMAAASDEDLLEIEGVDQRVIDQIRKAAGNS